MISYILQVVVFQLVFLLVYELLLKKETFFHYNRIYLLLAPLVSCVLPLLKIGMLQESFAAESLVLLPEVVIGGSSERMAETSAAASGLKLNWWLLTYALGFLLNLSLFLYKFRSLNRLFIHKKVSETSEMKLVLIPQSKIACTFFNTIFLGEEITKQEREQILSHEIVHVRQRHTLDLLYFELWKILFWFNPLVYIYQSRISAVHEFLADAGVVKKVEKQQYYQQLLNSAFNTRDVSFVNQFFNYSLIKKRIAMLQRSRSTTVSKLKFLILLPLVFLMLTYVSLAQGTSLATPEVENLKILEVEDLDNMTTPDKTNFDNSLNEWRREKTHSLVVTDGLKAVEFNIDPVSGAETAIIHPPAEKEVKAPQQTPAAVPFAVVDEAPVFVGCEELATNEERKNCTAEKITSHVNKNFNLNLVKQLEIQGISQIYVKFKITAAGEVTDVQARARYPELIEEGKRVVRNLPKMLPGKQDGQEVAVLYMIPIKVNTPQ